MNDITDIKIIQNILDGNVNDFEYLLSKYQDYIFRVVSKHLPADHVEETAHEIFIRAYESLENYKQKGSFKSWLTGIAIRSCYDFWRKQYKTRETSISSLSENHQKVLAVNIANKSCDDLFDNSLKNEVQELLNWAMERFSPEDRMIIELVYFEGLSGKEVAKLLGWNIANVKIRTFRARKKLRKLLANLIED